MGTSKHRIYLCVEDTPEEMEIIKECKEKLKEIQSKKTGQFILKAETSFEREVAERMKCVFEYLKKSNMREGIKEVIELHKYLLEKYKENK